MRRWVAGVVGIWVSLPQILLAADLGPLAPLSVIGLAIASAAYLFGGASIVWAGAHAVSAYRSRDIEGMGAVWGWIAATVIGAILVGTIVPALVDPILARGATP